MSGSGSEDEMEIDDIENDSMPFASGEMVELHSLSNASFNGRVGKVGEYKEEKERYEIDLGNKKVSIRVKNLKKCENQTLARQQYTNIKLKHDCEKILRRDQKRQNEAMERKVLLGMGLIFCCLIGFTLYSTGVFAYIYYDSFVASYLQIVGEPVKDYALVPVYENVLVPANQYVITPLNDVVVQPLLGVVGQISSLLSNYIFQPITNAVKPISNAVSGAISGILGSVTGSGNGEVVTNPTDGMNMEDTATSDATVLNNDLVEDVEKMDL